MLSTVQFVLTTLINKMIHRKYTLFLRSAEYESHLHSRHTYVTGCANIADVCTTTKGQPQSAHTLRWVRRSLDGRHRSRSRCRPPINLALLEVHISPAVAAATNSSDCNTAMPTALAAATLVCLRVRLRPRLRVGGRLRLVSDSIFNQLDAYRLTACRGPETVECFAWKAFD